MTNDTMLAVQMLQKRLHPCSSSHFYDNLYWSERIDRAIDYILRAPDRSGNPYHIARNAFSDASKIIHRRSEICPLVELQSEEYSEGQFSVEMVADPQSEQAEAFLIIEDWLERASLHEKDREILLQLLRGIEAEGIALQLGITLQQARVQISRARKRAKTLWEADTNV